MAKWTNQVKLAWLKGVEVVGTSASNLASNAKHRVAEINLETRRREILTEFSLLAFDMWQKGEKMPEPLDAMLKELSELDERLSVLRAQKYAAVEQGEEAKNDGTNDEDTPVEAEPRFEEAVLNDEPVDLEATLRVDQSLPEHDVFPSQTDGETGEEGWQSPQE